MELLLDEELFMIEGGKNWWYIIGGTLVCVAGTAGAILYPGLGGKVASGAYAIGGAATAIDGWTAK